MMKKILLAITFIAGLFQAKINAQTLRLENVTLSNLSGLKMSADEQTFCNVYAENNTTGENEIINIAFYNQQFMETNRVPYEIQSGTTLLSSAFSGEVAVVVLGNKTQKKRSFITIDRHGNIMQKREEENVAPILLNEESYVGMYPVSPTEFVSIIQTSPKKNQYEVQRFTMTLDQGITIEIKSEKNKLVIEDVHILNDVVFLLCKETIGINNDKTEYYVKAINLAEAKIAYSTLFGESTASGLPTKMKVNDNMTVDLFGPLFNDGDMDKTPDGILLVKINDKGEKIKYMIKQWPELLEQSNNKILKDLSSGKIDILIEDMLKIPGSEHTVFLCEVFEKTNGGAGTANFAVKDFIMLKFSPDDQLVAIEKIEKTPKLATVKGTGATGGKYLLAKKLYNNHFFTYLSTFQAGEKNNIAYRYNDGKTDKAYAISVTDSLIDYKGIVSVSLDEQQAPEMSNDKKQSKKSSEKNIPVVTMELDLDKLEDLNKYNSLIFLQENHALIQQYRDGIFTSRIIGIPVR
jgi:hypothetical protein